MKNLCLSLVALGLLLAGGSCSDPKSPRGFALPDGDAEAGREAFVSLGCTRCHSVRGVTLPPYLGDPPVLLELGGDVIRVKNYGQLVTSMIHPDHVVSKEYLAKIPKDERRGASEDSPMPAQTDVMTVEQLIDLVAFLQPRYKLMAPQYDWQYYGY